MTMEKNEKLNYANKTCFIITPIGEDGSTIRRHINGIIDSAIIPVLGHNYEIKVAHRMPSPGSINKQVIKHIYEADLVIANLTNLNPNVMYELAFRHAIRKPVITIMEKGSGSLPFDVVAERTIFYINDSQGVLDLKDELKEYVEKIKGINCNEIDNPIYDVLQGLTEERTVLSKIEENDTSEGDALKYIVKRLDDIDRSVSNITNTSKYGMSNENWIDNSISIKFSINLEKFDKMNNEIKKSLIRKVINELLSYAYVSRPHRMPSKDNLKFNCYIPYSYSIKKFKISINNIVKEFFEDINLSNMNFTIDIL